MRLEHYRSENTNGRPKNGLRDEVIHCLKKLKLRNWSPIVKDRKAWNYLVQKTKIHVELSWQKKKKNIVLFSEQSIFFKYLCLCV